MTQLTHAPARPVTVPAATITALASIAAVCAWCRKPGRLRRAVELVRALIEGGDGPKYGCDDCLAVVEHGLSARIPDSPAPLTAMAAGCPAWCNPEHAHRFPAIDFEHDSGVADLVSSSLTEGERFGDVCGGIYQQPGGAARVSLSIHTHLGDAEVELTPEEALQAAYGLINKAMAARAASSR
ncbi:hypothetical protein GCM10022419_008240 [Nonomuraea rosea]|uniref:Uncharacterized protein n=1 Tax=Nonomuraea rosea TaxID=638574 RepID=A0ABP6VB80_9ACTN